MSIKNENLVARIYSAILSADEKADKTKSEVETLRSAIKRANAKNQSDRNEADKRNQSEIDRISTQHRSEICRINNQRHSEVGDINEQCHSKIDRIKSKSKERKQLLQKQIERLEKQHQNLSSEKDFLFAKGSNTRWNDFFKIRFDECDELMRAVESQTIQLKAAIEEVGKHAQTQIDGLEKQAQSQICELEKQAQVQVAELEKQAHISTKIKDVKEQAQNEVTALQKQAQDKVKSLQQQKEETRRSFTDNWMSPLNALCQQILDQQPVFDDFTPELLKTVGKFPSGIVFGRWHLALPTLFLNDVGLSEWHGFVPHFVGFPFAKPLYGKFGDDADNRRVHQLLLRLLFALPVGTLDITIIDPVKMGQSVEDFLPLLKIEKLVPKKRCLTHPEEIENVLLELVNYSAEMLQQRFQGKFDNWTHYNKANQENPLPYKLLLIFGFPEQFSDKSVTYLKRILENGAKFGILPVILSDKGKIQEMSQHNDKKRAVDEIQNILANQGQHISDFLFPSHLRLLSVTHEAEPLPNHLSDFLDWIAEAYIAYEESKKVSKSINDMWLPELFGESSIDGISTPIGWNADGQEVAFKLGARQDSEHHVLLAGRSGSGKSNVLHVLIHGLLHRYGADELNLYLLDYKEGVEINVYAKSALPQIKLVATESDREYGVTVLEHLCDELKRRSDLFKQKGKGGKETRSLYEYRDETGEKLPRVLLIIDEFQVLIETDDAITKRAIECFTKLFKQGRSAGVHVLLATQTLKGLHSSGASGSFGPLFTQIGCRIALSCGEEDSQLILSNSNSEAVKLKGKGDGIINNSNGQKSGNIIFNIPYADSDNTEQHLDVIEKTADRRGDVTDTKMFSGTQLPEFSPANFHEITGTKIPQIKLGEELNFTANPFVFQWERRAGNNLCITGIDEAGLDVSIRQGILRSLLECVQQNQMFDNIVYFNTDPYKTLQLPDIAGLVKQDSTWDGNISEWTSEYFKEKRSLFIIDAIDDANARMFHPKPAYGIKKDTEITPAESLKILLDEGPRHGSFVIVFVDNWNNFSTACKDYLNANYFDLRIGFRLVGYAVSSSC